MNNKILLVVFLVLSAIYGLSRAFRGSSGGSFRSELIRVDTGAVNAIIIDPKGMEPEFTLKREESGWIATNGQLSVRAAPAAVNAVLEAMHLIKTKNIVTKDSGKWGDYEVTESAGARVRIYQGEKPEEDFIAGRFNFVPQARSGVSYLRLTGENEVYAVDGFQAITFGQGFDAYRNHQFLRMHPEMEVAGLQYQTPDTLLTAALDSSGWWLGGDRALDSSTVASLLNGLRNLSGDHFADDFDEMKTATLAARSLTVSGPNIDPPLVISCYYDSTRSARPFILRSSQEPETFFASDSSGLFGQVFRKLDDLVRE